MSYKSIYLYAFRVLISDIFILTDIFVLCVVSSE